MEVLSGIFHIFIKLSAIAKAAHFLPQFAFCARNITSNFLLPNAEHTDSLSVIELHMYNRKSRAFHYCSDFSVLKFAFCARNTSAPNFLLPSVKQKARESTPGVWFFSVAHLQYACNVT
jgi:hypothetical protein